MVRSARIFFWRLDVLRIRLPELRERAEDVPAVAEHLLSEVAREQGAPALGFTGAALDALRRHAWPGNVRELRNVLERALLAARGRRVDVVNLPVAVRRKRLARSASRGLPKRRSPRPAGSRWRRWRRRTSSACSPCADGTGRRRRARSGSTGRTLFSKIQRHGLIGRLRPLADEGGGEGDEEDEGGVAG